MGLDMYLEAEQYLWDFGEEAEKTNAVRAAIAGAMGETPGKVKSLVTEAAYWRKANAIHAWFVENVQGGVDECQRSYVDRSQLDELVVLCKSIIANPESGDELLPTQGGFFFGSTEYDEGYMEDLKDTVKMLEPLLDEEKFPSRLWEFHYQSSW